MFSSFPARVVDTELSTKACREADHGEQQNKKAKHDTTQQRRLRKPQKKRSSEARSDTASFEKASTKTRRCKGDQFLLKTV